MKFLVVSDLHLHAWKYGSDMSTSYNDRLSGQVDFMHWMHNYALERDIRHIFFCGDWFHTHGTIEAEVLMATHSILEGLGRTNSQLHIIAGNHDYASKSGFVHSLSPLMGRNNVHVYTNAEVVDIKNMPPVAFLPYMEDVELLEARLTELPAQSLVFMHQGVSGVEVNSKGFTLNEILKPEMISPKVLHAFSGHYHSYKRVSDNLTIPGAPMQHNWGDKGDERGFLEVLLDGNTVHIKRVLEYSSPKFVNTTVDAVYSGVPALGNNFVKVISENLHEDIEAVRQQAYTYGARTVEVEIRTEEDLAMEDKDFTSYQDLFKEYVKDQDITGRKLKAGEEILANSYEAPEV